MRNNTIFPVLYHKIRFNILCMLVMGMFIGPVYSNAETLNQWTINMQDKADNYARWLDHPPKNRAMNEEALTMRKLIYTCTMLKAYSINDWCASASLTRRWLVYAQLHGFIPEINGYKQTTKNKFIFPKKTLNEIKRSN